MRSVSGILLVIISAERLFALDPALAVSQYLHTAWTQEEGADLPGVEAITQTPDGYLWLGTTAGLIRFDGLRFVHWEPHQGARLPVNDIRFLLAGQRGLWIGSAQGISRLDRGRLTAYPAADRWLAGAVVGMLEDHMGRLWMRGQGTGGRSLGVLLPNDSFQIYGQPEGLPAQLVRTMFENRDLVLWLGTSKGLCRWSPGSPADCLNIPPVNVFSLIDEANGDMLIGDDVSRSMLRFSKGTLRPAAANGGNPSVNPRVMLRDHDGNVWIGTLGQGLLRLSNGHLERFTRRDGLSSDIINALSEDREGDLWIGTSRGIDRIRDPKVVHLSSVDGLSSDLVTAVYASREGGAWVGMYGGGLNHVNGEHINRYGIDAGLPSRTVTSLYQDANGTLWVATSSGLVHSSGERFVPVRVADGRPLDRVLAISGQSNGALAVADSKRGLFSVKDDVARPMIIPGLPKDAVYQLQFDRSGVLWVGYYQGGIAAVTGNSVRLYTAADGLGEGWIRAIYQDAGGDIWVGTKSGLSRLRRGRWNSWTIRHGLPEGGVRGIVEDGSRHAMWLVTSGGLVQVSTTDLDAAQTSAKPLNSFLYGRNEGLRLVAVSTSTNPPITMSDDGRIWLCTEDGLAIVDPGRIRSNPLPPPVVIEQMTVDGTPLDLTSGTDIVFRGRQLQIAYTALSLMAPERIRFKYRLDGVDRNWTEADGRRNVDYVGLPPAHYRFRVIACNNDGVWNNEGAALAFLVKPYYYQTWWFAAACLGGAGLLAWGAHRLRVQRVVSRLQLIARERARLTRELHDSLLQGFAGVVYQLEAVSRQFYTAPEASRQRLERAIDQADRSLLEARRTILSMRLPALENRTLPEALSAIASQLTEDTSIAFHLEVKGRIRQLPYDQQANVYLIGREAITNSVNHARASRIVAALVFSAKELRLAVQDDGSGFDPQTGTTKRDHWGMRGMRERAASIGATFTLDAAPGRGTKIEIVVPRKG
ncbi:putative Integral membrane sensor signal transduction histidine kinase [Candidatus Sulfopaludibacter sp. SbA3]|nr:putative Integral membrane sensor signal transduction histidine kinase [Candidatus Sulfopaludibacter sp. SbA3]